MNGGDCITLLDGAAACPFRPWAFATDDNDVVAADGVIAPPVVGARAAFAMATIAARARMGCVAPLDVSS
jgi:hypothetical protein